MTEYLNTQVGDIMGYALEGVLKFIITMIGWWYVWLGIITILLILILIFSAIKRLMYKRYEFYE